VLFSVTLLFSCSNQQEKPVVSEKKQAEMYTCPMHPQILEAKPGSCPICGMTLVKKSGQASEDAGISLNTVLEPVNSSAISSVEAITPKEKEVPVTISVDGYLDYDTRTFNNIASRFSGRIEKLYIKYAFQEIKQGERLFDIYSPELVTGQQDLIYLVKNSSDETSLIRAAKQKLLLLGMTGAEIEQVVKSERYFYSLPVYSPYTGHVHNPAHSPMAGAGDAPAQPDLGGNTPLPVKEGTYVNKGQTLFNVVNPHMLWAVIKMDPTDILTVKLNQPVSISLPDSPCTTLEGKVDFIEPTVREGDRTTSIRIYLHNMSHQLKVGSLVKAKIETGHTNGLWIPRAALIDQGESKIVWLREGAAYHAHQVATGIINGNQIQIVKGLSTADSIAASAQYLSDSESFIKNAGK